MGKMVLPQPPFPFIASSDKSFVRARSSEYSNNGFSSVLKIIGGGAGALREKEATYLMILHVPIP